MCYSNMTKFYKLSEALGIPVHKITHYFEALEIPESLLARKLWY